MFSFFFLRVGSVCGNFLVTTLKSFHCTNYKKKTRIAKGITNNIIIRLEKNRDVNCVLDAFKWLAFFLIHSFSFVAHAFSLSWQYSLSFSHSLSLDNNTLSLTFRYPSSIFSLLFHISSFFHHSFSSRSFFPPFTPKDHNLVFLSFFSHCVSLPAILFFSVNSNVTGRV